MAGLRLQPAPHHLAELAGAAPLVEPGAEFHAVSSTGDQGDRNFHGIFGMGFTNLPMKNGDFP